MQGAAARVATRPGATVIAQVAPALAVSAITVLAGALRLYSLARVPANPFYDAGVRSMSLSWHNFLFAAFDPAARLALDKPPLDLWLQVASVKLLGFNQLALKLPEALAGTACVPLLYDLVRRVFGRGAGLAAALALAVLPITVLTSRSDTMDTMMMLLVIAAAWLVVHAAQTGRARFLYLAAVAMGLAFNVKLFEALLPLPALPLLYLLAAPHPLRRRLAHLLAAGAVFVALSLSWVVAVSAAPASARPYPIGSTNGSVWNSMFVFDGVDRLGLTSRHPGGSGVLAKPSPTRLVADKSEHLGGLVGVELVPALILGALAFRRRSPFLIALALWLALGVTALSISQHLQIRYLETLAPAIAAALGIGIAGFTTGRRAALAAGLAAASAFEIWLARGTPTLQVAVVGAAAVALIALTTRWRVVAMVAALLAMLAVPAWASVHIVRDHATDASLGARLSPQEVVTLDRYLTARQGGARYEVATLNAWQAAPLIVRSGRPVLVLRNVNRRPLLSASELRHLARSGQVRYALLGSQCGALLPHQHHHHTKRACPPAAHWARAHGRSVRVAGHHIGLYRID